MRVVNGPRNSLRASPPIDGCQDLKELSVCSRAADCLRASLLSLLMSKSLSLSAGGVEEGSVTFQPCCEHVNEWVTVEEHEIAEAMVGLKEAEGISVEGSAGVSLASFLKTIERWKGKSVAIVCCGGNISQETYAAAELLARTGS